jgi:hypothetical protein
LPLFSIAIATERVRFSSPSPQDVEQVEKPDQEPQTQSTGQSSVPHSTNRCNGASQVAPPFFGTVRICRVSMYSPPPHETEQLDTAAQSDSSQSTGHGAWLQGTSRCSCVGQASPS